MFKVIVETNDLNGFSLTIGETGSHDKPSEQSQVTKCEACGETKDLMAFPIGYEKTCERCALAQDKTGELWRWYFRKDWPLNRQEHEAAYIVLDHSSVLPEDLEELEFSPHLLDELYLVSSKERPDIFRIVTSDWCVRWEVDKQSIFDIDDFVVGAKECLPEGFSPQITELDYPLHMSELVDDLPDSYPIRETQMLRPEWFTK